MNSDDLRPKPDDWVPGESTKCWKCGKQYAKLEWHIEDYCKTCEFAFKQKDIQAKIKVRRKPR